MVNDFHVVAPRRGVGQMRPMVFLRQSVDQPAPIVGGDAGFGTATGTYLLLLSDFGLTEPLFSKLLYGLQIIYPVPCGSAPPL